MPPSSELAPFHPVAELRVQNIRPYADLLLHDMGADLADSLAVNPDVTILDRALGK